MCSLTEEVFSGWTRWRHARIYTHTYIYTHTDTLTHTDRDVSNPQARVFRVGPDRQFLTDHTAASETTRTR